jgi:S-formylglutathione hydrolase FrmB
MAKRLLTPALSVLALLLYVSLAFGQQATPATATASKLLQLTIPTPALKGNLLGDPTEQPIYVYLPPGYESSTTRRYPTLYLLHGYSAKSSAWIAGGYQGFNLQSSMDELIKEGKVREMIVVAANGFNAYGGSFYTNSPVTGNWEDVIVRDLLSYVDTNYRTLPRAESRGIAGHSMGGYGAIMLAMKHPELFSAVYALSPCCMVMDDDMSEANAAWPKVFGLTSRDQLKAQPKGFADFFSIVFVALSAAFSPNPARPPFFADYPYESKSGLCGPPPGWQLSNDCPLRSEGRCDLPQVAHKDSRVHRRNQ